MATVMYQDGYLCQINIPKITPEKVNKVPEIREPRECMAKQLPSSNVQDEGLSPGSLDFRGLGMHDGTCAAVDLLPIPSRHPHLLSAPENILASRSVQS